MTKQPRHTRRKQIKLAAETLAEELRAWRATRVAAAKKRAEKARKKADKNRKRESRGVDRVPARYLVDPVPRYRHTESPERLNPDGSIRRGGQPIVTEAHPYGNHAERRARSSTRRQRRRDIHRPHPWREALEEARGGGSTTKQREAENAGVE